MCDLTFRADIKPASQTLAGIDAAIIKQADDGLRPHLGASLIGRECERALWYGFRWSVAKTHPARILRLFARGQREEEVFVHLLRQTGVRVMDVNPHDGKQYSFKTGHFGGSMDAACIGLPEAPKTWHVVEFKTHGNKSFTDLAKHGVEKSKPEHAAQMQCYMAWTGMTRALYMAVNKDTDELHLERIDFDKAQADKWFERAARIIDSPEPPLGLSRDPAFFKCKMCDYSGLCHQSAVPLPTCRSCAHATPEPAGTWACERHHAALDVDRQKAGCDAHRYIPKLLAGWAEVVDASDTDNWVTYRLKNGNTFTNGARPDGLDSAEIHACTDKNALGEAFVQDCRADFDARVVA